MVVLVSTRDISSYRRRLAGSPVRGFIPKDELSGECALCARLVSGRDGLPHRPGRRCGRPGSRSASRAEWIARSGQDLAEAGADLAVGWAFIACGLIGWSRRPQSRVGLLLTLTGFAWFLGTLAASDRGVIAALGAAVPDHPSRPAVPRDHRISERATLRAAGRRRDRCRLRLRGDRPDRTERRGDHHRRAARGGDDHPGLSPRIRSGPPGSDHGDRRGRGPDAAAGGRERGTPARDGTRCGAGRAVELRGGARHHRGRLPHGSPPRPVGPGGGDEAGRRPRRRRRGAARSGPGWRTPWATGRWTIAYWLPEANGYVDERGSTSRFPPPDRAGRSP